LIEDHTLEIHKDDTDQSTIFWPVSGPAFIGDADPGVNWRCAGCGTLLASAVYHNQFLDVLFRCHKCHLIGASPLRQPGQPLIGRPLVAQPGRSLLLSAVDVSAKPTMIVGKQALDGYQFETGVWRRSVGSNFEISADYMMSLAKRAVDLLGENYANLWESDQRGKLSPTPPPRRHRLIELIDYALEAARALRDVRAGQSLLLDGPGVSELHSLVELFERWSNHPAARNLAASLSGRDDVEHVQILLAYASYLCDNGNGVGIVHQDRPGNRIADLWVEPSLSERMDVEIKTPLIFRGPLESPLDDSVAEKTIGRAINKAASTRSGQLDSTFSGMLVLGTFHLSNDELYKIHRACERILYSQRERKRHLAAVAVTSFRLARTSVLDKTGAACEAFAPSIETKVVRHPGYAGSLLLEEDLPLGHKTT
jgi:hypothetical protein